MFVLKMNTVNYRGFFFHCEMYVVYYRLYNPSEYIACMTHTKYETIYFLNFYINKETFKNTCILQIKNSLFSFLNIFEFSFNTYIKKE